MAVLSVEFLPSQLALLDSLYWMVMLCMAHNKNLFIGMNCRNYCYLLLSFFSFGFQIRIEDCLPSL